MKLNLHDGYIVLEIQDGDRCGRIDNSLYCQLLICGQSIYYWLLNRSLAQGRLSTVLLEDVKAE